MCRSCTEYGSTRAKRRCDSDSSLKRRLRRKASQQLESTKSTTPNADFSSPAKFIGEAAVEASLLHSLLKAPSLLDENKQDAIDAALEERVTALGERLADKAEESIAELKAVFDENYDITNPEFEEAAIAMDEAMAEEDEIASNPEATEEEKEAAALKTAEAMEAYELESNKDDLRREKMHNEYMDAIALAYRNALSEVREMGGTVKKNDLDDEEVVGLMNKSVGEFYPSAWLQSSNEANDNFRIQTSDGERSYFRSDAEHVDIDTETAADVSYVPAEGYYVTEVPEDEANAIVEKIGNGAIVTDARSLLINDKIVRVIKIPTRTMFDPSTHETDAEGNPIGKEWTYGYHFDPATKTTTQEKIWTKENLRATVIRPTVMINTEKDEREQKATALHEFGHRMESLNPAIPRLEEAWLRRRTTDTTTGTREDNSLIYPQFGATNIVDLEFGRRDGFVHHYIGKEYPNSRHREVLSMGLEAVFGGTFSGLIGANGETKADKDHRNFILGVLASA